MCEKSASNLWRLRANVPGVSCVCVCWEVGGCLGTSWGGDTHGHIPVPHCKTNSYPVALELPFYCCHCHSGTTWGSDHPWVVGWKLNYWSDQWETNKTPCCPNMVRSYMETAMLTLTGPNCYVFHWHLLSIMLQLGILSGEKKHHFINQDQNDNTAKMSLKRDKLLCCSQLLAAFGW